MYKNIPTDLKKFLLDSSLYKLHKEGIVKSDFGMDNSAKLLDEGFGLYSTADLKKNIGPMKTDYFRISLTLSGNAHFDIGLEKYNATRNYIVFGFPGQVFSIHDTSNDFFAYYMLFSEKFIADNFLFAKRREQFGFLTYSGVQCFEINEETANEIRLIILKMNEEIKNRKAGCSDAIKIYIQLILILANRHYGNMMGTPAIKNNSSEKLFTHFVRSVNEHFLTMRKVTDYADMLHVSPDHLNRVIKSYSAKTANELIDEMVLLEAKAYVLHSKMSIAEIAYQLEFADPSHFNKFFKKLCGVTPSQFRKESE